MNPVPVSSQCDPSQPQNGRHTFFDHPTDPEFFWCSRCHIALGKDWPLRVTFHDGTSYPRTELMSGRDFMNRFHG